MGTVQHCIPVLALGHNPHIIWVRFDPSSVTLNHIIPLLKRSKFSVCIQHAYGIGSVTKTENEGMEDPVLALENGSNLGLVTESLKYGLCFFVHTLVYILPKSSEMISVLYSVTHAQRGITACACIGVRVDHFDNGESFHCFITLPPEKHFK